MMADPLAHGLWQVSSPAAPRTRAPEGEIAAHLVVIGGGFTSCSASLHAATAGARVALLEAEEIGSGAAGRNVGLVNAGLWVMPEAVPAALGARHGERLMRQLGLRALKSNFYEIGARVAHAAAARL